MRHLTRGAYFKVIRNDKHMLTHRYTLGVKNLPSRHRVDDGNYRTALSTPNMVRKIPERHLKGGKMAACEDQNIGYERVFFRIMLLFRCPHYGLANFTL